jgi:hypothetical protein
MSYPFVKVIEDKEIKKDMKVRIIPTVKNTIYSLPNERKISVKTEVVFRYKVTDMGDVEILNRTVAKGDNLIQFSDTELDNLYKFNIKEFKFKRVRNF